MAFYLSFELDVNVEVEIHDHQILRHRRYLSAGWLTQVHER